MGPGQTAQAPGTAPGQAPYQGGLQAAQQAQLPQAFQNPQVAQQPPQQLQRQMEQQVPPMMQQVAAQPQPQQQAQQHPAQQQVQDQANFVQSMLATQQAELATLKAQVAAFEAAKGSSNTQDRIAERIEKDEVLNNEDFLDPDARAARVAQISFEELQRTSAVQHVNDATPPQQAEPILQELILERKIQGELGIALSGPQLQKVAEVASQIGGDSNRALAIASMENPAIFGGNAGFQDGPGGQGMLAPQGGYSPQRQMPTPESTYQQRLATAREGGRPSMDGFVRGELAGRLGRFFPGLAQG